MASETRASASDKRWIHIRGPQNFAAGLGLLLLAIFAGWASADLNQGNLSDMGPGMFPRVIAGLIALCGLSLMVTSFARKGESLYWQDFAAPLLIAAILVMSYVMSKLLSGSVPIPKHRDLFTMFVSIFYVAAMFLVLAVGRRSSWMSQAGLRAPFFIIGGILAFALTIRTVGLALACPLLAIAAGPASPDTRPKELFLFALFMTGLCIGLFKYTLNLPIPVLIIPGWIYL